MKQQRILVVEDDEPLLKFLKANLRARGYMVSVAQDGMAALTQVENDLPDLILLDINLPRLNGIEVCKRLRRWSRIPILIISARSQVTDKITCLDLGADDYITKPFSVEELISRINAVFRRSLAASEQKCEQPLFVSGDFKLNMVERCATVKDREIPLTHHEYELLEELVKNAGKILTHSMLLGRIWGPEYYDAKQYLHVIVHRLRKKIETGSGSPLIITVPGVGYKIRPPA